MIYSHWIAVSQIIIIDFLLSGDNAILIALACRDLPASQRNQGILWGTIGAILLRIILAACAAMLLALPLLKLLSGLLLLGIGIKLMLLEPTPRHKDKDIQSSNRLTGAIKTIIIADFAMSIDNIIGIAGAAQSADPKYRLLIIVFGLLVSFPLIIWGSRLMLKLLDRFPMIIPMGAALLGWIASRLMISDPFAQQLNILKAPVAYPIAGMAGALLVVVIGSLWRRRRIKLARKLAKISQKLD